MLNVPVKLREEALIHANMARKTLNHTQREFVSCLVVQRVVKASKKRKEKEELKFHIFTLCKSKRYDDGLV